MKLISYGPKNMFFVKLLLLINCIFQLIRSFLITTVQTVASICLITVIIMMGKIFSTLKGSLVPKSLRTPALG